MFLHNKYIFADDFIEKTKMHKANISMARNVAEEAGSFETIKKYGRYSFIDRTSNLLPNYITSHINNHTFEKMKCILPKQWMKKEFNVTNEDLEKLYSSDSVFMKTITVADLEFVEFKESFIDKMSTYTMYVLNFVEFNHSSRFNLIDGFIKMNKNSYLVWY